ncbi:MAG: hypothetical protein AAFU67_07370, partial [Bacteroidota bacterium]
PPCVESYQHPSTDYPKLMFLPSLIGQLIFYLLFMLWQEYAGFLLALIIGCISFAIWGISHIVEWIQPSRVSKKYYAFMLAGWIAPFMAIILFIALRGEVSWLNR